MSRPVRLVSVLMVVLILIGLALSPTGEAFFTHLLLVLLDWQRYLQRGLTMALTRFSGEASLSHALWLLGLSLGYGIFHAVGPGHGKAVISTYLLTHRAALGRGLRLTAAAALMQGVVAVALVGSLTLGLGMLTRESMASSAIIERISFALVVALGGWLTLRAGRRLWQLRRCETASAAGAPMSSAPLGTMHALVPVDGRFGTAPAHPHGGCGCGRAHHVDPERISGGWRESLGAVLAIGLRPCSGAIMLLGVSAMLGQWWLGVGAVLAMSVGTALTTSCLAALTVLMRERMQRIAGRSTPGWQSLLTHGLALCGGLLIMALGLALIALAGTAAPPPMMHGPL